MDIVLLKAINKLISLINALFPSVKNLSHVEIVILSTIIVSAIIAIFSSLYSLYKNKTIEDSFNSFMYSFLGGILGDFTGILTGLLLGLVVYMILPPQPDFISYDVFYLFRLAVFLFICWLIGVFCGGIVTIKPLTKFLVRRNR